MSSADCKEEERNYIDTIKKRFSNLTNEKLRNGLISLAKSIPSYCVVPNSACQNTADILKNGENPCNMYDILCLYTAQIENNGVFNVKCPTNFTKNECYMLEDHCSKIIHNMMLGSVPSVSVTSTSTNKAPIKSTFPGPPSQASASSSSSSSLTAADYIFIVLGIIALIVIILSAGFFSYRYYKKKKSKQQTL